MPKMPPKPSTFVSLAKLATLQSRKYRQIPVQGIACITSLLFVNSSLQFLQKIWTIRWTDWNEHQSVIFVLSCAESEDKIERGIHCSLRERGSSENSSTFQPYELETSQGCSQSSEIDTCRFCFWISSSVVTFRWSLSHWCCLFADSFSTSSGPT